MPNPIRLPLRRKLMAAATPVLLLASATAAAPAPDTADLLYYRETFYSDASHTVKVGSGSGYCDGDYIMVSGYQTSYSTIRYVTACP